MRKLLPLLLIIGWISGQAQILRPNEWTFELSNSAYKVGDEVDLILKATIDEKWYL